jgi:bifunctional non-homologous end joining protein LigD
VGLGALVVGYYQGGDLVYAGKVGTGFTQATLRELRHRLDALDTPDPPFRGDDVRRAARGPGGAAVHWVRPELVAEVVFSEWTADGRLRHPRFVGLRDDKPARDVVREAPPVAP